MVRTWKKACRFKTNAVEILDRQLANRAKKNQYGFIVISSATDPYLQIEKDYELTRAVLKTVLKHRFPVHIITKSDLIERDFDLLHQIDQCAVLPEDLKELKRRVIISFSFSTLQDEVSKIFEPGATRPSARYETLKKTIREDFLTGVSLMPLIPYVSDTTEQLHYMFSRLKEAKVDYVLPATITLFGDGRASSRTLMMHAIEKYYPELLDKYNKFFSHNTEMPAYYRNAFYKKMKELCNEYTLSDHIQQAARSKNGNT